jgi:hypothetical protein
LILCSALCILFLMKGYLLLKFCIFYTTFILLHVFLNYPFLCIFQCCDMIRTIGIMIHLFFSVHCSFVTPATVNVQRSIVRVMFLRIFISDSDNFIILLACE